MIRKLHKKKPYIAVIGDLMVDAYIWGRCSRLSPEAPVQIVDTDKLTYNLGGAGNVAANLVALGAKTILFSAVGSDDNSVILKKLLPSNIKTHLIEEDRKTTRKTRIVASGQQILRIDEEDIKDILELSQSKIMEALACEIEDIDVILISDYNKGVITRKLAQDIISLSNYHNIPILIDPKGNDYMKYKNATLLTPNKSELASITRRDIHNKTDLEDALGWLKNKLALKYGLATLSENGIAILDDHFDIIPTVAREVYDVTGAGDTVLASLAIAIANNLPIQDACRFANTAAAVVVSKIGSAAASLQEIEHLIKSTDGSSIENKIVDEEEIAYIVQDKKSAGQKIVFTNGCFDILHRGHAYYLEQSKKLGDILIVGLNSDKSVKSLKGSNRPIYSQNDRAYLLASLESVDFVVIFNETTPYSLIKKIKPNILTKGSDYKNKEIIGSDLADNTVLIDFIKNKSTTSIINKITKAKFE